MTPQVHPGSDPDARGSLLVADRVVTLGHGRYRARCLLMRGSRVTWVGDDPDSAPPHQRRIDLSGCTIGPSFVDSHVHMTSVGIVLTGLDLSKVATGRELLAAVASYAEQHTGRVIYGHGYDPHDFPDPLPTPDELSAAGAGRPVYLSRSDGHSAIVDRLTLSAAPLARSGGIEREADGTATGVLRREANQIIRRWSIGAMTDLELHDARSAAAAFAAHQGIGGVHEMGGQDLMGVDDFDAWALGEWPVEVTGYWGGFDLGFAVERDLRQIGGGIYLDGSIASHTAALDEPYADSHLTGELEYDDDTLTELFLEATNAGLQVAVHAVGDAAVRQAVRCWRETERRLPDYLGGAIPRLHHRLEYAAVLPPDLIDDIADLGLLICAVPSNEARWGQPGGMYERRLGTRRAAWTSPLRELADRGVNLAFGSSSNTEPMDPWAAVLAAEARSQDRHGITRLEAISTHTLGGRLAARQERHVGVLRAGMRADFAVWEGNPYSAADPRGHRCVLTVVKGRRTHGRINELPSWDEPPGQTRAAR